ncbi:hypothetical protein EON63_24755 [archaeon]|nr:MAG: hypothetical protein EON63_24755 [archaeon]
MNGVITMSITIHHTPYTIYHTPCIHHTTIHDMQYPHILRIQVLTTQLTSLQREVMGLEQRQVQMQQTIEVQQADLERANRYGYGYRYEYEWVCVMMYFYSVWGMDMDMDMGMGYDLIRV